MKFKDLAGRDRYLNIEKKRIDWGASSLSKFQKEIKDFLYAYWRNNVVYEEMRVVGTKLRIDFYNATKKIAIECNGAQHNEYNEFFHKGNRYNYLFQMHRDDKKYRWCQINGITLIEIEPKDLPLTENFFEKIGVSI